jgi:hypothetical protein
MRKRDDGDGISPDIPHDQLLDIAWVAVKQADRAARGLPEGGPSTPVWWRPEMASEQRAQELRDQRSGRSRQEAEEAAAENERVLIRHLAMKYGPSGAAWEPPSSRHELEDRRFRELCSSLKSNSLLF